MGRAPASAGARRVIVMSDSVQLVFADFELLIWLVIIVGSLIAQAIKSIREKQNPPPADVAPKRKPRPLVLTDAQAELEEFLESLSRESGQPAPPEAPVVESAAPREPAKETVVTRELPHRPPPIPPSPLSTSRTQDERSADPVPRFERRESSVARIERPVTRAPKRMPSVPREHSQPRTTSRQQSLEEIRKAIGSDLIDNTALRKAILLQEILSKPLALRTDKDASSRE